MGTVLSAFYQVLIWCALPGVWLRLFWRSQSSPAYRLRISERFGFYSTPPCEHVTVIHAVSVGEAMATKPLVEALLAQDPYLQILITCTTPTGSARIVSLYGSRVMHLYLPYDYPFAIRRFLDQVKPTRFIVMETEWWPNLFAALKQRQIPLYIVNARLSESSFKGYHRVLPLTQRMLSAVTAFAAQSQDTAEKLACLGVPQTKIFVTGSIKYDVDVHPDTAHRAQLLRTTWGDRPVWVVASTHAGEEPLVMAALKRVHEALPTALTIWAPRHLERFVPVKQLCEAQGHTVVRRSLDEVVVSDTQVYLADTMGELSMLYACADVAFVGGSMIPIGGHNILEPALMQTPVITGPHMQNFQEITDTLVREQGLVCVTDSNDLAKTVIRLLCDPEACTQYADRALKVVNENRGATRKIMGLLGVTNSVSSSAP